MVLVEIGGTFEFTAPAEVVYNSLTDPDRAGRWLPPGVRLKRLDGARVLLEFDTGSAEYEVSRADGQLRVVWSRVGAPDFRGTAEVRDAPAGGSRVNVVLEAPGPGADPGRLRDLVSSAAGHLRRDVSDNFNAG